MIFNKDWRRRAPRGLGENVVIALDSALQEEIKCLMKRHVKNYSDADIDLLHAQECPCNDCITQHNDPAIGGFK